MNPEDYNKPVMARIVARAQLRCLLSIKLLLAFRIALLLFSVAFVVSCGSGVGNNTPPPITNKPGADTSGFFFATSVGGTISGMTADSGQLTENTGIRLEVPTGIGALGSDPAGAFLVGSSSPVVAITPTVQIINIQSGGTLSAGPTFAIPGDSEGIAIHNNLIAITDLLDSTLRLYQFNGANVSLISTANTDLEPHEVIFDLSGTHLYVANSISGTVSVFSVSTIGELQLVQSVQQTPFLTFFPLSPRHLKLNHAGTKLAVACDGAVFVWNVSAADGSLSAPIDKELTLTTKFQDLAFDPTGQMVYLLDAENNLIYGFAVSDYMLTALIGTPIQTAAAATAITTNGNGDRLYALEMVAQVETFSRNTVNGSLKATEVLPIHLSSVPGQLIRVPKR